MNHPFPKAVPALLAALLAPAWSTSVPARAGSEPAALDLQGVQEAVEATHELGAIVDARVAQSRARRRQALADLLPQASLDFAASWVDEEVAFQDRTVVNRLDWDASGSASITLFDGTAYPRYRQRRHEEDVVRAEAAWDRRLLRLEAEEAFHTLAAADREVALAEEARAIREQQVAMAKRLVDAGVALPLDHSRARADLLRTEQRLLEAHGSRGTAADALGVLLGHNAGDALRIIEDPAAQVGPPAPRGVELDRRADFLGLGYDLDALGEARRSLRWKIAPKLELSTRVAFGPTSFSNPDGFVWSATLRATWELYDGGRRYAEVDEAEAILRERELTLRHDLRVARAETARVLRDWNAAWAALGLAGEEAAVAREALDMALARFERGVSSSLEVREAATGLDTARVAVSQARLRVALAGARYRALTAIAEEAP